MLKLDFHPVGQHFLQIPGPSPVPERILRAMSLPTIDHRGPEFGALGLKMTCRPQGALQNPIAGHRLPLLGHGRLGGGPVQYPESGRSGSHVRDRPFRVLWTQMANRLGLKVELAAGTGSDEYFPAAPNWRRGIRCRLDRSTAARRCKPQRQSGLRGAQRNLDRRDVAPLPPVRAAIDAAKHPALLLVDIDLRSGVRGLSP